MDSLQKSHQRVYDSESYYIITFRKTSRTRTNESRLGVVNPQNARYRANTLKVIEIKHRYNGTFLQQIWSTDDQCLLVVGQKVTCTNYDENINTVRGAGIKYYLNYDVAFYDNFPTIGYTGKYKHYRADGTLKNEGYYIDGAKVGTWIERYPNGNFRYVDIYARDELVVNTGYYDNGNIAFTGGYANKQRNGLWKFYYDGGELDCQGEYVNGTPYHKWSFYTRDGYYEYEKYY